MRFRTHARWLSAVAVLLVPSCASEPQWAPAERIAGTWHWVRSVNVKTGDVATPSSVGVADTLAFTAHGASGGTFTFYRAGASPISGTFSIGSEDAPGNDFITISVSFPFLTRNAWVAAGGDSLRLGGVFEGGFNSTYARVKE
jgi:hypothetical protein